LVRTGRLVQFGRRYFIVPAQSSVVLAGGARLEVVGRAVATGRLYHKQDRAIATTIREWLKAHEAGTVTERVEELQEQVAALRQRKGLKAVK
jgi:hypothetical protein